MKYIVIGGVVGGVIVVVCIRRNMEQVEIILFEKGEYILYVNCGLFYYIGGVIVEWEKLFVQILEVFGKCFNIDVCIWFEVIVIYFVDKIVDICIFDGKIYMESYDKLLFFLGVLFVCFFLLGIDNEGIFILCNVNDIDVIKSYLQQYKVKWVVIIGVGFIGLEMVENLQEVGVEVVVVEMVN